jgi:hypothetical protein
MATVWRTDTAYAERRIWLNLLYTMYSEQALNAKAIAQSFFLSGNMLVELDGIEPTTPCLQSRCSPS